MYSFVLLVGLAIVANVATSAKENMVKIRQTGAVVGQQVQNAEDTIKEKDLLLKQNQLPEERGETIPHKEKDILEQLQKQMPGSKGKFTPQEQKDLIKRMQGQLPDERGKAIPHKIIPSRVEVPRDPIDKKWGRRMSELQWSQDKAKIHANCVHGYKQTLHNKNAINDNKHDRKGMKIPRNSH